MRKKFFLSAAILGNLFMGCAQADTTVYDFSGLYYVAGGSQSYNGTFTIDAPVETNVKPAMAPDMNSPVFSSIWAGTSKFFTGGVGLDITFASGTHLLASTFDIVVNNTIFQGTGSPYPEGLSVQLYPSALTIVAPTSNVCATPTGVCGEDDDPLYHDATQNAIMGITDVYFAFYNAPLSNVGGMPNLVDAFGLSGGLGIRSGPTTTLTSFNAFSSTVYPSSLPAVPEPETYAMLMAGLGLIGFASRRKQYSL